MFNCPDVSFFQYVTGLFSAMSFARTIKSEFKILNMKIMDMKKFITWWTGVNLDGSGVLDIHVGSLVRNMIECFCRFDSCPVHRLMKIGI